MRQAIRIKAPRAQISEVSSFPAPVGGWNAKDALANMPPLDAVRLRNWFPSTSDVRVRGGRSDHATGITGTVETLAVYNKMNGTSEMFAMTSSKVYDVSNSGAAVEETATITEGRCQYINFGDGASNWLIAVNGTDKPLYHNGSTWTSVDTGTSPALTGLTSTSIVHVNEYKGRIIFLENDSLSFWYLPAGVAGGALTEFDLSSYCSRGGYLMWCATWSFDAGDGPDDACVFMTSEGEVIVYRGTDPSTAADWGLAGVYFVGKPLGRRSFCKYGGDLVVITQDGAFPLSKALQSATVDPTFALTDKIQNAFNTASGNYGSLFGWEALLYPAENALIFNIPNAEGGIHQQYVMNTITKAWCEFDSWDGECFAEYNKELYYGYAAGVRKAWTGTADGEANIEAEGKSAFNYFGNVSQQKKFKLFRPLIRVNGTLTFYTGIDVDFADNTISAETSFTAPASALWDTAVWDTGVWAGDFDVSREWASPWCATGYAAAGAVRVSTNSRSVKWVSSDYVYERGGVI